MSLIAWLGVVSAIITILAFLFAVWVWMKSNTRVRDLEDIIQTAYDITGAILWDMQTVRAEDSTTRLRNAEKSLGQVSALRAMTGKYAKSASNFRETEIGALLERGVIWSTATLFEVERSERVQEIWLVTPDLQPDLSDATTGRIVAGNLKNRKRYVYFCPDDIEDLEAEKKRLLANIGASRPQEASRVTIVPVGLEARERIFQRGNTIIFFAGNPDWGTYNAFEEVVFTKVSERGVFWQEHTPAVATETRATLKHELEEWHARHPA
jgi:hypothetical protein